ncbi:MAG: cadherin-like domain-containing protein [Nanoarchaeota archaeon]|nr:cadherin-like domain-containing protein [Nanoarchaeota archaeon]MBU1501868.1 cadherin-like domain-containing protein [Nanoarchaeota archaeon]
MKQKLIITILASLFLVLLISSASAIAVTGSWKDGNNVIKKGESITLYPTFISVNLPMTISIKLEDSNGNFIRDILPEKEVNAKQHVTAYEIKEDAYKNVGAFKVVLSGRDSASPGEETLYFTVNPNNVPPAINHAPVAGNQNVKVVKNTPITLTLTGSDADEDPLTYLIVSDPEKGVISGLDSFTGKLTYTPNKDFVGDDSFTFKVNDGNIDSNNIVTVSIDVKNVETPTTENTAPRITSTPVLEIVEGQNYNYQVTAEDDDGDDITFEFFGPSWLSMDSENLIKGTAPLVDANQGYNFGVKVSDPSKAFTYMIYSLKVIDSEGSNNAPVASSRNWEVNKNTPKNITLIAQDADEDSLTYSIVVNPVNGALSEFDSATGKVTYTPKKDFVGSDSFTFKAKDGKVYSGLAIISIVVKEVSSPKNNAPVITSTPVVEVNERQAYSYQVTATDAEGDVLSYVLFGPDWLSMDSTGLISGTAPSVNAEEKKLVITVQVFDDKGKDTIQRYILNVKNVVSQKSSKSSSSSNGVMTIPADDFYSQLYEDRFNTINLDDEQQSVSVVKSNSLRNFVLVISILAFILLVLVIVYLFKWT